MKDNVNVQNNRRKIIGSFLHLLMKTDEENMETEETERGEHGTLHQFDENYVVNTPVLFVI